METRCPLFRLGRLLVVPSLGLLLGACAVQDPLKVETRPMAANDRPRTIEQRIHQEVNALRRSQGLPPLARHKGLDALCRTHANYMIHNQGKAKLGNALPKTVTHYGFEGRVTAAKKIHGMGSIAENAAFSKPLAGDAGAAVVRALASSAEHRKNMLDHWKVTGVGVTVDANGNISICQIFALPRAAGGGGGWAGGPSDPFHNF